MGLQAWVVTIWHASEILIRPINNHWKIIVNCTLMVLFLFVLRSHYNTLTSAQKRWLSYCFILWDYSVVWKVVKTCFQDFSDFILLWRKTFFRIVWKVVHFCSLSHLHYFFFLNIFSLPLVVLQVRMPLVKQALSSFCLSGAEFEINIQVPSWTYKLSMNWAEIFPQSFADACIANCLEVNYFLSRFVYFSYVAWCTP